jgi:hypothetical protein
MLEINRSRKATIDMQAEVDQRGVVTNESQ